MNLLKWLGGREEPKPYVSPLQWQPGEKPSYVFCESTTVTTAAPWHIRKIGTVGLKLGGGIDTPSLCGFVLPLGIIPRGFGGWDLNVRISEHHLGHSCKDCVIIYRERLKNE